MKTQKKIKTNSEFKNEKKNYKESLGWCKENH